MTLKQAIILLSIFAVLLVLLIVIGLMMINQAKRQKSKGKTKSGSFVSKEKFNEVTENLKAANKQLQAKDKEFTILLTKYSRVNEKYDKTCSEIIPRLKKAIDNLEEEKKSLELKIRELIRDNDELSKLAGKETAPIVETTAAVSTSIILNSESKEEHADSAKESFHPIVQDTASTDVTQGASSQKKEHKAEHSDSEPRTETPMEEQKPEVPKEEPKVESPKEKTMYASFPRSAGSRIYFSDLSENRVDDSYFELKVYVASGKATFKPLDFMKIRNYDPAMAAMLTEGVKPNIASTVIGIEPGKAHIEGKDWIIDNLAKIKLA